MKDTSFLFIFEERNERYAKRFKRKRITERNLSEKGW